jgi:hypothetical protein
MRYAKSGQEIETGICEERSVDLAVGFSPVQSSEMLAIEEIGDGGW